MSCLCAVRTRDQSDIRLTTVETEKTLFIMLDRFSIAVVFVLFLADFYDKDLVYGLDNGLALTPPSKSMFRSHGA